jgi:hypothetical protein
VRDTAWTLHGENLHGVQFEGVRYIVVQGGKITSQQVWNDLAESGVLARGGTHAVTIR